MSDLKRIEDKLDKVADRISRIDITLTEQAAVLKDHTRRSTSNEENISLLRSEFKPLEKHVNMVNGALKLIGVLALLSTIAEVIIQLFRKY